LNKPSGKRARLIHSSNKPGNYRLQETKSEKHSERGLPLMELMETVEIREERADSHRSHKPGENARREPVKENGAEGAQ
jgi:hypothetical protein